jgi:lipopolysaccharide export system protein LptC
MAEPSDTQTKDQRLSNFKSRTYRKSAGKTAHIKYLRMILPITAVILTLITIFWTFTSEEDITSKLANTALETIAKNELLNPRFTSADSKNQPYTITAKRAVRGEADENLIILSKPAADITLESGHWLALKSEKGAYNQSKSRLILRKKIHIFDNQGYMLETEELNIDLKEETMLSETPVYGQGPAGSLQANGMYGNFSRSLLVFKGPAKLTLNNLSGKSGIGELR